MHDGVAMGSEGDEISLLDLLITLLENVRLLVIGPLMVGLVALAVSFGLPRSYESVAVLRADLPWLNGRDGVAGSSPAAIASLMTTAAVLNPVASELGLAKDSDLEAARIALQKRVKVAVGKQDRLLTLTASADTPALAQQLAQAVLQETYEQSRPKGGHLDRIQAALLAAADRQAKAKQVLAQGIAAQPGAQRTVAWRPVGDAAGNPAEAARNYADILRVSAETQQQIIQLETEMAGLSDAQLVQSPTLPTYAVSPKKTLIAIFAAVASGMLLVMFVFIRQALRTSMNRSETAQKWLQVRALLGFSE
ncbi:MAG: hypothetical protein RJA34_489 [Pseudomonadota bacterium]|jgi:uncharacterized protein involved in exopolysaccharide biosynthesis